MALDYTALLGSAIQGVATYAVGRKQANTQKKIALQQSIFLADQESGNQQYNMAIRNNPGSARARVAAATMGTSATLGSCGAASPGGDDGTAWLFLIIIALGASIVYLLRRVLKKKGFMNDGR